MDNITQSIDLTFISVSNMLGVMLIIVLLSGNIWRLRDKTRENRALLLLMFFTLTNCLVDPLVYAVDGKPSTLYRAIIYAGNSWLFFAQLSSAVCWVVFFCHHLNGAITKRQKNFLVAVEIVNVSLLLANLFFPLVFDVTAQNVYVRKSLFFVFAVGNYLLLLDSIVVYFISRIHGGTLKFFPLWVFALPVCVGGVVQSLFYGVSINAVCLAISVAGILSSLQNELIFRDHLTGLFNRSYLDYLLKIYYKKRKREVTGIMLDLNSFKSINDRHGHSMGDDALINASTIFRRVVSDLGLVIRYAGDEFILLINSQEDRVIASCMSEVRRSLQDFNQRSNAPYRLVASMGSCKLDFEKFSIDDFINEIDRRMYEDKKNFYSENADMDRRKSR